MLRYILGHRYKALFVFVLISIFACDNKEQGAKNRLNNARELSYKGSYVLAKQEIDSLKTLYPKAFTEIRASNALLDTIRFAENLQQITICDSLILLKEPKVEAIKKLFIFQQDKRYQESGIYVPKELPTGIPNNTMLRCGVAENGELFIESVVIGNKINHNQIRVSASDDSFADSKIVSGDGLIFRSSIRDKSYEIIKMSGVIENGLAKFISENLNRKLIVTLLGNTKYSYILPKEQQEAIVKSHKLATFMLELDSLNREREKAAFKNYYLQQKHNKIITTGTNAK